MTLSIKLKFPHLILLFLGMTEKKTSMYLTSFEYAALLATRVSELERGKEPTVEWEPSDSSFKIAENEFKAGTIPCFITRVLPGGEIEMINPNECGYNYK
jgi:DNA-directed RNA polymerase subunit K/omega